MKLDWYTIKLPLFSQAVANSDTESRNQSISLLKWKVWIANS